MQVLLVTRIDTIQENSPLSLSRFSVVGLARCVFSTVMYNIFLKYFLFENILK
jgi:hypothetical protein